LATDQIDLTEPGVVEIPIQYEGMVSDLLNHRYQRLPGTRIGGIEDTTQNLIIDMVNEGLRRGYSPLQIANGVDEEGYGGVVSIFDDEYRAEMIARTESMFALNWGAGNSYADSGISEAEALDGVDDPECAARNGQIFTIDPDTGQIVDDNGDPVEDHPNGTLAWAPNVTDQVVATGALNDSGDVTSFEGEQAADYEVKYGTGQTNNSRGGNQHGAGPKIPRKHKHANGITHRHIGGARPHSHASGVSKPKGAPFTEAKYSVDQPRDHGRFGFSEGAALTGQVQAGALGGGFTIGAPTTGFQVAIPGHATTVGFAAWHDTAKLAMAIHDHLTANQSVYAQGGEVHLGGWLSPGLEEGSSREGALIIEPSEQVASREEAIKLGVARDQVSIWDNANRVEIQTGGQGAGSLKEAGDREGSRQLFRVVSKGTGGSGRGDGRVDAESARSEAELSQKYSEDQPRVPAGSPGGGQFGGGGSSLPSTLQPSDVYRRMHPGEFNKPPAPDRPSTIHPELPLHGGGPGWRAPMPAPPPPPSPFSGQTAVSAGRIGGGHVNEAYHVEFKDGSGVCFKPCAGQDRQAIPGDACREVAGYTVDQAMGPGAIVPATALLTMPDGISGLGQPGIGSGQLWAEGAGHSQEPDAYPIQDQERMAVLDYVTQNCDRHGGNYMTGPNGELVAPDNSMTFGCNTYGQYNDRSGFQAAVNTISPELMGQLQAIDQSALADRLNAIGIPPAQTQLAIGRLQAVIASKGDAADKIKGWASYNSPAGGPKGGWANPPPPPGIPIATGGGQAPTTASPAGAFQMSSPSLHEEGTSTWERDHPSHPNG
jgi:hypothetical protein